MHLIHVSTVKAAEEITISLLEVNEPVNFKRRTFTLKSEEIAREFHQHLKEGNARHRAALAVLTRNAEEVTE